MFVKCICKHCGGPIEVDHEGLGRVADCPHCGQKTFLAQPPQNRPGRVDNSTGPIGGAIRFGCGLIAFIGLAFFIIAMLVSSSSTSSSKPGPSAGIKFSRYQIFIENKNTNAWAGMKVYINGMPPSTYEHDLDYVESGGVKVLDLDTFTKRNGERFRPDEMALKEIWIGGGGYDYQRFGE